jgi:hypothetical protein
MDQLTSKSRTICPELAASTRRQADLRQVCRAPLHQLWRRRISVYSSSTTPDRLHQHCPWSSSPITIYINKIHHVAAITDRGHRQRQQNLLLLLLATLRNFKQKIRV